jgi:hypothetical protein
MFEVGKKYKSIYAGKQIKIMGNDFLLTDEIYTLVSISGGVYGDWQDSDGGIHRGWNLELCFNSKPIEKEKKVKCHICDKEKTNTTLKQCTDGGECAICHECEEATLRKENEYDCCIECISKSREGKNDKHLDSVIYEIDKKEITYGMDLSNKEKDECVFQKIKGSDSLVRFTIPEKCRTMEYVETPKREEEISIHKINPYNPPDGMACMVKGSVPKMMFGKIAYKEQTKEEKVQKENITKEYDITNERIKNEDK